MKTKLLVLFFFLSIKVFSQYEYIKAQDLKKIDSVQVKLKSDTIAYNHFLFIKKCWCYDKIDMKVSVSNDIVKWMNYLGYPIFVTMDNDKVKKSINAGLDYEIEEKKKQLAKREEKFYLVANKYIICESITSNTIKNKNQFFNLVNDINNFDKYKYQFNLSWYLKNIKYTNDYWGIE